MKQLVLILLLMSGLAMNAKTLAERPDYNFLEGGLTQFELDAQGADGLGIELGGAIDVTNKIFVFGNYENGEDLDGNNGVDIDLSRLSMGGAYHHELTGNTDFVGGLAFERIDGEADGPGFGGISGDDNGLSFHAGIRSIPRPAIDIHAFIKRVDYDGNLDDTSLEIGGWYMLNDWLAAGLEGSFGDEITTYAIKVRLYHKKKRSLRPASVAREVFPEK